MYERFTDRCRKVMKMANLQAMRFHHEYIGTEHVLLGLIEEGSGVAIAALKSLGFDVKVICRDVEQLIQLGPDKGKLQDAPQTPRAKKVVEYAMEEARKAGCDYVGTEHILLGLLRGQESVAAVVLINRGVNIVKVREEIAMVLSCGLDQFRQGRSLAVSASPPTIATEIVEPPPPSCPKCGEPRTARVIYEYSHLSDGQKSAIESGKAILCTVPQIATIGPPWVCLRCAPAWSDVHRLAMHDYQSQVDKEEAVRTRDFEAAARHRDSQLQIRRQIARLLQNLWQGH
jgi:hypothetical protein